jgi:hypothetical protein
MENAYIDEITKGILPIRLPGLNREDVPPHTCPRTHVPHSLRNWGTLGLRDTVPFRERGGGCKTRRFIDLNYTPSLKADNIVLKRQAEYTQEKSDIENHRSLEE